ncbi:MAG: flagellar biosynthetic protein FliR [Roseovarius sp.]
MSNLADLLQLSQDVLWLHFLVLLRVGPVMSLFPGFGERSVPARIKLVLTLAMTVIIAPAVQPVLVYLVETPPPIGRLVLSETLIGLTIGIGIRLFILALQTAGSIAAQSISLAHVLGNAGVTPLPAMGHLLVVGALALSMMLGLHVLVAQMMVQTYTVFPAAQFPDAGLVSNWGISQISNAFALAFTLAAPFVIVSVLYNLTLGIINRAMPQMMVVFVGAPVITWGGLVLLMLLAPTMLTVWVEALNRFIMNPFGG